MIVTLIVTFLFAEEIIMIVFNTDRLIVRNFIDEDIDTLHAYRNDPECARYQIWKVRDKEGLKDFIKDVKNKKVGDDYTQLAITLKENNRHIGDLYIAKKDACLTIGYTISRPYQHNGYGIEVVSKLVAYIKEKLGKVEIVAMIDKDNSASINLINKLKFTNEGYNKVVDSLIFSLK